MSVADFALWEPTLGTLLVAVPCEKLVQSERIGGRKRHELDIV